MRLRLRSARLVSALASERELGLGSLGGRGEREAQAGPPAHAGAAAERQQSGQQQQR